MTDFKVHFIHVGNMNNKGTQALFSSDVSVIKEIVNNASVTVSTTDIAGVKKLNLPLSAILTSMVDIPYDHADQTSKNFGFGRNGFSYKLLTATYLILMPIQTVLSLFSVLLSKFGAKSIYRRDVIEHVKNCNLVISHSDESFKETASSLPLNPIWAVTWWSMLFSRTIDVMVARAFGKPVILFPNSVGPFRTFFGKFMARLSLNSCDYLLIRDPISFEIVDKLGITASKILTYDTALLFNQQSKPTSSLSVTPQPVIGVSAGIYSNSMSKSEVQNYIKAHAQALDAAIEKHGFHIAFLPHYISGFSGDDMEISKRILEKMKNKQHAKIIETESVSEFHSLLNQMKMVISSKMHPAILAVSSNVPVLSIVYDHKQTGFFQRLDMINCTLDIGNVSSERLLEKINQTWLQKEQLKEVLASQIPLWQLSVKSVLKKVVTRYLN